MARPRMRTFVLQGGFASSEGGKILLQAELHRYKPQVKHTDNGRWVAVRGA